MRIIQISDTHLSPGKQHFADNWPPLAAWIRARDPDLVIHTGDVTVDGAAVEADLSYCADLLNELGVRWCAVPGNLDTGDGENIQQDVAAGQTLKVTLVWTDPPGDSLQNDLDLIVKTPDGQEFHGNIAPGSSAFDRSNNVEQVIVPVTAPGTAMITVRAFRAVSPQSYALVIRAS